MDDPTTDEPRTTLDRQPQLESELLHIRPLRPDDHEALRCVAADPLIWEQHPSTDRSEPEGFRRWFEAATASGGALVVIDRRDGSVIGTSRYDGLDPQRSEVEIGWTFLARSHWGGVVNTELKRLMLEHAFGTVDAVLFRVHSDNHRSQRAVQKLGATYAATEPFTGAPGDVLVFRLDRRTFERPESPAGLLERHGQTSGRASRTAAGVPPD